LVLAMTCFAVLIRLYNRKAGKAQALTSVHLDMST
jgi:hypothetical protein